MSIPNQPFAPANSAIALRLQITRPAGRIIESLFGTDRLAVQKRKTIRLVALFAAFVAVVLLYFIFPRWRAARAVRLSIASMSQARSLSIEGQFVDHDEQAKKQIGVVVTNAADIAAIAALFQSARPKLDLRMSYDFARGAKLATLLHGTVTIVLDTATNEITFLSADLLVGDANTAVRLDGFSSEEIYATLKKRKLL